MDILVDILVESLGDILVDIHLTKVLPSNPALHAVSHNHLRHKIFKIITLQFTESNILQYTTTNIQETQYIQDCNLLQFTASFLTIPKVKTPQTQASPR